jgi:hypothetical protein
MKPLTRRRVRGAALTAASLMAVIGGMSLIEPRVHSQVGRMLNGEGMTPEVASAVHRMQQVVMTTYEAVHDKSIEHATLAIFAVAAAVLVAFMFRT